MRLKSVFIGLCLLMFSLRAAAQEFPKYQFYGGYSYARISGAGWNGWLVEGVRNFGPKVGIVADVSGPRSTYSDKYSEIPLEQTNKMYVFMAGPRLTARGPYKLTPHAHLLLGVAHNRYEYVQRPPSGVPYAFSSNSNRFTIALGGGIDYAWKGPLAIRGQVDIIGFHELIGNWVKGVRVSGGLAIRWGISSK